MNFLRLISWISIIFSVLLSLPVLATAEPTNSGEEDNQVANDHLDNQQSYPTEETGKDYNLVETTTVESLGESPSAESNSITGSESAEKSCSSKTDENLINAVQELMTKLDRVLAEISKQIQGKSNEEKKRFKRGQFVQESPYKACVYIESTPDNIYEHSQSKDVKSEEVYPPEAIVNESFAPESNVIGNEERGQQQETNLINEHSEVKMTKEGESTGSMEHGGDDIDIDLNRVFWMKLPSEINNQDVRAKAEKVFDEVREKGKDVLIIPVSKSIHSSHELSQGLIDAMEKSSSLKRRRRNYKMMRRKKNIF